MHSGMARLQQHQCFALLGSSAVSRADVLCHGSHHHKQQTLAAHTCLIAKRVFCNVVYGPCCADMTRG